MTETIAVDDENESPEFGSALLVPLDESEPMSLRRFALGYSEANKIVGDPTSEGVYLGDTEVFVWVGADSRSHCAKNVRATEICDHFFAGFARHTYLPGPCLFTSNHEGVDHPDLPSEVIEFVRQRYGASGLLHDEIDAPH